MNAARKERNGLLVVLEGLDGTGKTTQARLLETVLAKSGVDVVVSREPTNGPVGCRLRETARTGRLAPREELDAFEADRKEHVQQVIAPSLSLGRVVILDRYYFSSAAYQGARGLDPRAILTENERFAPAPDLLVVLHLPVDQALERIATRGNTENRFERRETLERCARIFDQLDQPYLVRINAARPALSVHAEIVAALAPLVQRRFDVELVAELAPVRSKDA